MAEFDPYRGASSSAKEEQVQQHNNKILEY
jgi:hypothetical protein